MSGFSKALKDLVDEYSLHGFEHSDGIITVGQTGQADFPTIGEAISASVTGDVIVVNKGTYNESVTIPDGVRIIGSPLAQEVVIAGADTTSSRVSFAGTGTLREVTVVGPSSGSNPAIDATTLGVGKLAVLFNMVVQGGGGDGDLIAGAGSGILAALGGIYHNGGSTTAAFIHLSAGATIGETWVANVGVSGQILRVSGTASVDLFGLQVQSSALYNCTDKFNFSSTGNVIIRGASDHTASPASVNGMHITGDNVALDMNQADFFGSTTDILVDPALTGSGSSLTFMGCKYRNERISAPTNYFQNLSFNTGGVVDLGVENDPSFRVVGELSVGSIFRAAESAFGEGDSSVNGMQVWTTDSGGTVFTDQTDAARSRLGSTFDLFEGTGAGHICYVGAEDPQRKFYGLKTVTTTGIDVGGGEVVCEFWNGSAWQGINLMVTDSGSPYSTKAQAFLGLGNEHIRFDAETLSVNWATTTINGLVGYWIRFRIDSGPISTIPVVERFKLHTQRTEINEDGFVEYFGLSQPTLSLQVHQRLTDDIAGSSPSNGTINVASGMNLSLFDNLLSSSNTDEFGWLRRVPENQDTSREILFRCIYSGTSGTAGTIRFRFAVAVIPVGTVWDGSTTSDEYIQDISWTGSADESAEVVFNFSMPDQVAGDLVAFKFGRLGAAAEDTYVGNVEVGLIEATCKAWF